MTGKATLAACEWIQAHYPGRREFMLSGNIDTDKKHSQINMLLTRGKRVVAEAVIKKDLLEEHDGRRQRRAVRGRARSPTPELHGRRRRTTARTRPTAWPRMFIATGQDVANVAESHAGIVYTQLLPTATTTGRSPCRR